MSCKRTSIYFHRAVILFFWKVNQILPLLNLKLTALGINPQTIATDYKNPDDVAAPTYLVSIKSQPCFLRLTLKEASEAVAWFSQCAMFLPTTRACAPVMTFTHSALCSSHSLLILQVFQLQ